MAGRAGALAGERLNDHFYTVIPQAGWKDGKGRREIVRRDRVQYKSKTFLAFKSDEAAGIAIPVDETKHEMDSNPQSLPEYVFFKTTVKVVAQETKQTYPFRYLKPDK